MHPDLIWSRINKTDEDSCWEWMGSRKGKKYGNYFWMGKQRYAHRAVYTQVYGEIPKGLNVCHKCDNGFCCNPNHLFLGTQSENMLDAFKKGRVVLPNKNMRFTKDDVIEIRNLASKEKEHISRIKLQKRLAQKYAVSTQYIHKIINGEIGKLD